jgi:hypothetical protein
MLDRFRSILRRDAGAASGHSTYLGLRSLIFTIDPETLAFRPDAHVHGAWCCVVDMTGTGGTATLLCVGDGTVSLYTSKGGGVIGAGGHGAVWDAGIRLLEAAGSAIPQLRLVGDPPPIPAPGQVRLSVRTFAGDLSDEVDEATLRRGRHVLSPLYAAAQDVLIEVRLSGESRD